MTEPFASRLEALLREATEGPWQSNGSHWGEADVTHPCSEDEWNGDLRINGEHHLRVTTYIKWADANLIVHLRNHAPALLEVVKAADESCRDCYSCGDKGCAVRQALRKLEE